MSTWSTFEPETRDRLAADLQAVLVDLVDLSLLAKQAHWTVVGPTFAPVHAHLDELTGEARAWSDRVAERAVAIGAVPDGQAATVAAHRDAVTLPVEPLEAGKAIGLVADAVEAVARRGRAAMERAGGVDAVTEDLLIEVVGGLEHQLWLLRAQLA